MKTISVYLLINDKELIYLAEHEFYTFSSQIIDQSVISIFLEKQQAIDTLALEVLSYDSTNHMQFVVKVEIQEMEFLINVIDSIGDKTHIKIPAADIETLNKSIVGRVKPIHVYIGNQYDKERGEELKSWIHLECGIYESRLETFLKTKSRKIVPFNYFDRDYKEDEEIETSKTSFDKLREKAALINTVDEAVDFLINECLSDKELEAIKDETALAQIKGFNKHFGINMYLRNLFFYSRDNDDFKKAIDAYTSGNIFVRSSFGELGEGLLADVLWRRLHKMELQDVIYLEKIQQIDKRIDDVYDQYFIKKGFEKGKLTEEQINIFIDDHKELREKNSIDELNTRRELLSYNINEENIEKYLTLDAKKNRNDDSYFDIIYEMESIIGELKEEERPMFEHLKKEYFEIYAVYEQLEDLISSKK